MRYFIRDKRSGMLLRDDFDGHTADAAEAVSFDDFADAKSNCEIDEEVISVSSSCSVEVIE